MAVAVMRWSLLGIMSRCAPLATAPDRLRFRAACSLLRTGYTSHFHTGETSNTLIGVSGTSENPRSTDSKAAIGSADGLVSETFIDERPYDVQLAFQSQGDSRVPRVCYALAHNRIPFVSSLYVRANDAAVSKSIRVKVRGEWATNDRSPIKEAEFVLDAPGLGSAVELAPVTHVQLSDVALADLEELSPATLILDFEDDLGRRQTNRFDLDVFSRDQWLAHPDLMVLTAAFVQPNHPDVSAILKRAGMILEHSGHSGVSGYQGVESGQHHRIAEAIFIAMQEIVTTYVNPPASFESIGQKLRPIDRVLEEKQGTCIDLACAYAACLEQAGLFPVIFRVSGHAFAGYLTRETELNSSVIFEWPAIQSLIDSGLIVGVETVGIPEKMSFASARQSIDRYLNPAAMFSVLDVARAHREGVRPIPARIQRDGVLTVVIDNGPTRAPVIERRDSTTRRLLPESVPARVQAWKNSLLDLSFRNRLLNLRPERHGIELLAPLSHLGWIEDELNADQHFVITAHDGLNAIQEQLAKHGGARALPQQDLLEAAKQGRQIFSTVDTKRFKTVVSRMRSEARLQEEESGANSLYLTLGSVKWSPNYGSGEYISPIFLVPVRIANLRGINAAVVQMDATQTSSVNYCLIEALRHREQLKLQWFSDDMSDDLGLNVEAGLEALRAEFREQGLDVRGFSVDQSASIALLDFEKFRLWKDLSDHWRDFVKRPVVKHLVETPRETFADPAEEAIENLVIRDTSTICAQPADGSQIRSIERALVGSSFVLQGPPGSGKSQTITNLLANAMFRGKRVLFVAEKQAALQEVQERLEAVNLGPYCLVLHDSGTKPEALRTQLRDALEQRPLLDEAQHRAFEDRFEAAAHQLDEYRKQVYSPNNAGFSFARAYYRLGELGDGPAVEVPRTLLDLDLEVVASFQRGLLELDDLTRPARVAPNHPWSLVGDIRFESVDRGELASEISNVLSAVAALAPIASGPLADLLAVAVTIDELRMVADVLGLRETGQVPTSSEWTSIAASDWASEVGQSLDEYSRLVDEISSEIVGHATILRETQIEQLVSKITTAAKSFPIGRKKRLRESMGVFGRVVDLDSMNADEIVGRVTRIAKVSARMRDISSALISVKGLTPLLDKLPIDQHSVQELRSRADALARIGEALTDPGSRGQAVRALLNSVELPVPGLSMAVRSASNALATLAHRLGSNDELFRRWASGAGCVNAANLNSRETWEDAVRTGTFLSFQRWLNLRERLRPYRNAGLLEFCDSIEDGSLSAIDAPSAFERGLLLTTLQVRAEETNLDVFDGSSHNVKVNRFIELLDERRERAQTVIPYYLFRSRSINAGVTTGKVGEFRREVNTPSKRRRGKSIRFLIERYPEIISDLTPCFLMSPDSVAQFLPPGTINFDIVVFDEASQIVVADAIGAIGRADSCVIVGDSKQMPPTKFGVVDASNDEAETLESESVVEEEESILEEAVIAGFHQELLTWHYRSQDESLIAFSNEHYYDSRLSTFPAPVPFRADCGVFYVRVNGQFDHGKTRTNEIEAKEIIRELVKRLDDPATSQLSYGIVTLNIQQRNLIMELLDQHPHPMIAKLRETEDKKRRLFVLNLENVQGRERDVIILGTSFSKRVGGGTMPLNFGPPTQAGGEKRLNVAVTRAKRQFVVVSSFDPEEMSAAKSLGMVHLREYLTAAKRIQGVRDSSERTQRQISSGYKCHPQVARVADRLRERGIIVEVGRGLSNFKIDLALTLPEMGDEWLVAVLFDGEEWSERPLAIDRDALPVAVLENVMSWRRVARVWMPSLRLELDNVIDELVEHVSVARDLPVPSPTTQALVRDPAGIDQDDEALSADDRHGTPTPISAASGGSEPKEEEVLPNQEKFSAYSFPPIRYGPDAILTTFAQGLLEQLVDNEGPMLAAEALKRVAREFGLQQVRSNRLIEMAPLLGTRVVTEVLDEEYVWPASVDPGSWRAFRQTSTDQRKIQFISPYEIVNAMEVTIKRSITISPEELVTWTADFFGAGRLSAPVRGYLVECVRWAKQTRRFLEEDGYLTLS